MKKSSLCHRYDQKRILIQALCLISIFIVNGSYAQSVTTTKAIFKNQFSEASLLFTENRGQVLDEKGHQRSDILFTAHTSNAQIFLTKTGIFYQFKKTTFPNGYEPDERKVKDHLKQSELRCQVKIEACLFKLLLQGSNPAPVIKKEAENAYTENFYGEHIAVTGVHTYERIVYENVYPGINWVVYIKDQHLEHDFVLQPGASPNRIRLKVVDAEKVSIAADGGLLITTRLGKVKEAAPTAYNGSKKIPVRFKQDEEGQIYFDVLEYNKSKVLIIDPAVTWATYYGGTGTDIGNSCAVDASGNVFLAGYTRSVSGIFSGGFQNNFAGANDAFLVKFSSDGMRLWATYYGGNDDDYGYHCTVDAAGNIYMAGYTYSSTGIGFNGFQNSNAGNADAFLAKFSTSGGLLWSTYYGGNTLDNGNSCVTDTSGNVYLSGFTYSNNGIASNGFQNNLSGGSDLFLVKFSSTGTRLWATYYGGSHFEYGGCYTTDISGNVYLVGSTLSTSGIAYNGFQNTHSGGFDAFVVKLSNSGARLWATYYGGSGDESPNPCAIDTFGNIYIAGHTNSTSGIASGGYQNNKNSGEDAFLLKMNGNGAKIWATYFGGNGSDYGYGCTTDISGNVYLTGQTYSDTNIAYNGFKDTLSRNPDGYLAKFSSNGSLLWATYYGGNEDDYSYSCAADTSGNVYLSGYSVSPTGIAHNGFQNIYRGFGDAFLAKINGSSSTAFISIANGDWNNPATWSGGVVPSAGSIVIINTVVSITANAICYSLTVNSTGLVTVSPGINLTILH